MRDPLHATPLQGGLLQQALDQFPELDVSAVETVTTLESTSDIITALTFAPLEEYGISRSRFRIVLYLAIEEMMGNEPPTPSAIAENLNVTRATITDLLDGLERASIVERRHAGRDRRTQAIHLTNTGRQLFAQLVPPLACKAAQIVAPLSPGERQALVGLLRKLGAASGELITPTK